MNAFLKSVSAILLLAIAPGLAAAQGMRSAPPPTAGGSRILSFETAVFPTDSGTALVQLHYRLARSFFVLASENSGDAQPSYHAGGEMLVEILNEQGIAVNRSIRTIGFQRTTSREEPGAEIQDAIAFHLQPGRYRVQFELKDGESGRTLTDRRPLIVLPRPGGDSLAYSTPLIIDHAITQRPDTVVLSNRGDAFLFGNRGGIAIVVPQVSDPSAVRAAWRIVSVDEDRDEPFQPIIDSIVTVKSGALAIIAGGNRIAYGPVNAQGVTVQIPLPVERLEPGAYEVRISMNSGAKRASIALPFHIVWPARPGSLAIPEIAFDAMRHIASPEEFDEMTSFSQSRSMKAFRAFWIKRDPDTSTAYNEVMAEYFRRVDEAIRRYSTAKETDGYKTDRGKILVLFGTPARTERLFRPSMNATETWYYPAARKKFIFSDPNKTGNYILIGTETL